MILLIFNFFCYFCNRPKVTKRLDKTKLPITLPQHKQYKQEGVELPTVSQSVFTPTPARRFVRPARSSQHVICHAESDDNQMKHP